MDDGESVRDAYRVQRNGCGETDFVAKNRPMLMELNGWTQAVNAFHNYNVAYAGERTSAASTGTENRTAGESNQDVRCLEKSNGNV